MPDLDLLGLLFGDEDDMPGEYDCCPHCEHPPGFDHVVPCPAGCSDG